MRPIDRIVQASKRGRRSIVVLEWDDLELFFGPLTLNDMQAVEDRLRDDGLDPSKREQEKRVTLLIQKAELEDGERAFDWGDREHLMAHGEWAVVQRVIAFMYASSFTTAASGDEAKKKSERTEGSSGGS